MLRLFLGSALIVDAFAARPSLMFVLVDDTGFNDVGYNENNSSAPTPRGLLTHARRAEMSGHGLVSPRSDPYRSINWREPFFSLSKMCHSVEIAGRASTRSSFRRSGACSFCSCGLFKKYHRPVSAGRGGGHAHAVLRAGDVHADARSKKTPRRVCL